MLCLFLLLIGEGAVSFGFPGEVLSPCCNQNLKAGMDIHALDSLLLETQKMLYQEPSLSRRHTEAFIKLNSSPSRYPKRLCVAYRLKGHAFLLEEKLDSALANLFVAERLAQEVDWGEELAHIHNLLGACYQMKGQIREAASFGFRALKELEEGPDLYLASTLENLGRLFAGQQKYEEAQDYYLRALGIRQSKSDSVALARTLLNIAEIELRLRHYQQAKDYNLLALAIFQSVELTYDLARAYQQLGYIMGKLGQADKGISKLEQAAILHQKLGNTSALAQDKTFLGEIYLDQKNVLMAELLIREAMALSAEVNKKELLLPLYQYWANILSLKGLAQPSLLWYQKAYQLRDSLFQLEHTNHLTSIQADMVLEVEKEENARLKLASMGQVQKIESQKTAIIIFNVAFIALLIMCGVVYHNRLNLWRAYEVQKSQKKEIEKQAAKLREANEYISQLNEELEYKVEKRSMEILEKNKLLESYAYDLSHNIRSPLSNVLGLVHLMKNGEEELTSLYLDKLEQSAQQLDKVLQETNKSIHEGY